MCPEYTQIDRQIDKQTDPEWLYQVHYLPALLSYVVYKDCTLCVQVVKESVFSGCNKWGYLKEPIT